MNKEDFLQKYRNEHVDEGWESVHRDGVGCGYIAFALVMFLMFFLNASFRYDGATIFFNAFFVGTLAINNYTKYKFLREKKYFRRMLFFAIWEILILMMYISEAMGG